MSSTRHPSRVPSLWFAWILAALVPEPMAAANCVQEVRFQRGASSATYSGHISGYDHCDYVFTASAGQTLTVRVTGKRTNRITPVLFDPEQQVDIWRPLTL